MLHKKIHKHLKRKIHHNRWLVWTIAGVVLAAASLVSYIEITNIDFERGLSINDNKHLWQSYRNHKLGFSIRFPSDWAIESDAGILSVSSLSGDNDVTLTVMDPASEPLVRKALDIQEEDDTKVDGMNAVKIKNQVAPEAYETVILVSANNQLYRITGFGDYFDGVVSTLKFIGQ